MRTLSVNKEGGWERMGQSPSSQHSDLHSQTTPRVPLTKESMALPQQYLEPWALVEEPL